VSSDRHTRACRARSLSNGRLGALWSSVDMSSFAFARARPSRALESARVRRSSSMTSTSIGRARPSARGFALSERASDERADGRATYAPESYSEMCRDAFASVRDCLEDGKTRIEVEFPAIPGEDADYKAASDVYIDANVRYALAIAQSLNEEMKMKIDVVVPDGVEYRRAKKIFEATLDLSPEVRINALDGVKNDVFGSAFSALVGNKGLRTRAAYEIDNDFSQADAFIVVNLSTIELETLEKFTLETAKERPVICLNTQLDTLRADLGLFSFPSKDLHYRFLSTFTPAFYMRMRNYSRTINVSPFVVNYSGAVFREYPAPWQVMIKQSNGVLACVAEADDRFTLAEAKEEMLIALGINDPDDSPMKKLRSGYKTSTWWEDDTDKELSDAWRT